MDHYCRYCNRTIRSLGWATYRASDKHRRNVAASNEIERAIENDRKWQDALKSDDSDLFAEEKAP